MTIRALILTFLNIIAAESPMPMQQDSPPTITPAQVQALMEGDTAHILLDVRTIEEFDGPSGHLRGAILIPVQDLEDKLDQLSAFRQKSIVVICRSGNRSAYGTTMLRAKGFAALNMTGGMIRWNAEGRAVVRTEHR